jgi:hypothetical protein
MDDQAGKRTQDTFEYKRFVWPYVLTTYPDGRREVEVRDAICPLCRGRASFTKTGDRILLQCRRCNISVLYSPFESYDELKAHVAGLIMGRLETEA